MYLLRRALINVGDGNDYIPLRAQLALAVYARVGHHHGHHVHVVPVGVRRRLVVGDGLEGQLAGGGASLIANVEVLSVRCPRGTKCRSRAGAGGDY